MAVSDWSATPSANTTLEGINVAEGCPSANLNDVIRAMAAAIKTWSLTYSGGTTGLMPKSGGAFTGSITRSGGGAYTYFASSGLTGGAIYVQPSSQALPSSPAEGTIVYQY